MYIDKRLLTQLLIEKDIKQPNNKAKAIQEVVNEYCELTKTDIEEFYNLGLGDETDDLVETLRDMNILLEL